MTNNLSTHSHNQQSIPEQIRDDTVTDNPNTHNMGKPRRSNVARRLERDVITLGAECLPIDITLLA